MMSLESIHALSREQAKRAARDKKQPYVFFDEGDVRQRPLPIPQLGDHVPKGWKLVSRMFVDKSGFGSEGEPAMTIARFLDTIAAEVRDGNPYGYGIVEEGQFQIYVGRFERVEKKAVRRPSKKAER